MLPGLERNLGPHEALLQFLAPPGQTVLRETNPVIYMIVSSAKARLIQIGGRLNYLGYRDEYVPPWRFRYLLERARYFAEQAKNAQRDYLNFLANAEREEFQEMSTAQNVVLEKSNIRAETTRVEQARLEMESAKMSAELAALVSRNADTRAINFARFNGRAGQIADNIMNLLMEFLGVLYMEGGRGCVAGARNSAPGSTCRCSDRRSPFSYNRQNPKRYPRSAVGISG